jgi:hypothetical protein
MMGGKTEDAVRMMFDAAEARLQRSCARRREGSRRLTESADRIRDRTDRGTAPVVVGESSIE